jgi:S1-C subfamily serine protease
MTRTDWLALAFIAVAALLGLRRGLIGSALSLVGIVAGAVLGGRLAPHLIAGGDESPYAPLIALAGAALGALVLEAVGTALGGVLRRSLWPLRTIDSAGGLALGAAAGVAVVWVAGAVALHLPGQTEFRQGAQRSIVLRRLNEVVPPDQLIRAIQRVDPFPAIAGSAAPVDPPVPGLLGRRGVQEATPSVVRVLGNACGLAVSGSGWVAGPRLVVTAAHVVAGQTETTVEQDATDTNLRAIPVVFDARNDVAVLRVVGRLGVRSLRLAQGTAGEPVVILGYPENGPFTATPGRLGRTTTILSEDAYGQGPVLRSITNLRGTVRHGNSGGPAVNAEGEVETMIFAARVESRGGFGVPPRVIRRALASAGAPVSTGECAP